MEKRLKPQNTKVRLCRCLLSCRSVQENCKIGCKQHLGGAFGQACCGKSALCEESGWPLYDMCCLGRRFLHPGDPADVVRAMCLCANSIANAALRKHVYAEHRQSGLRTNSLRNSRPSVGHVNRRPKIICPLYEPDAQALCLCIICCMNETCAKSSWYTQAANFGKATCIAWLAVHSSYSARPPFIVSAVFHSNVATVPFETYVATEPSCSWSAACPRGAWGKETTVSASSRLTSRYESMPQHSPR